MHPFNGLFSRITWLSEHQKGKPFWMLMKQEMIGWQWTICKSFAPCFMFQTDNHASTSPLTTKKKQSMHKIHYVSKKPFCTFNVFHIRKSTLVTSLVLTTNNVDKFHYRRFVAVELLKIVWCK